MKYRSLKIAVIIVVVLLSILAASMALVLHDRTLVDRWIPICVCLAAAIPAGFITRNAFRALTGFVSSTANFLIALAASFIILYGCFYTVNYYCTDHHSQTDVSVAVIAKYSEEHYRVKRVSRGRTTRGEKYMVYYMTVLLPDGRVKKMEIPAKRYRSLRADSTITLSLENGYFGFPVIKNISIPVRKYTRD